jgi:predicted alpha/beta superfamily hydrolase
VRSTAIALFCIMTLALSASAEERQLVTFEVVHTPSRATRDVYVLGDLPELGGDDLARSVKLVSSDRSTWRVTVSLPVNRTYTYHYYDRFRDTAADPANGIPFGNPITDHTSAVALLPSAKIIYAQSSFDAPVLHWRQDGGSFETLPLVDRGPAREVGERRWEAGPFGEARRPVEFFLTSSDGAQRDPAGEATYQTPLDALMLQDGEIFPYVPAAQVSAPRRDYEVLLVGLSGLSNVSFHSSILGADYDVRVLLPRGYDAHRFRHYPVLYFADGTFVWEDPFFGEPFDADASISAELTRLGAMREVIQVAIDNVGVDLCSWAATRLRDYAPPGDSFDLAALYPGCTGTGTGQADRFAAFLRDELKPWIDAQYRTLPDREHTAFAGWSAGGLAAFYLGWDFPDTFGRVGAQSFSNPLGTAFVARVHAEPKRSVRVYLDAGGGLGDSATYQRSLALRDDLLTKVPEPYVLEQDLRHFVGALDQSHAAPAAGSRWTEMLPFLFPGTEERPACYDGIDNDGDGAIDYAAAGGDAECATALDPSERRNDCSDGVDNDGDGLADAGDPGCPFDFAGPEDPPCDDGADNDGNGLVDLDDPKCESPHWPYWEQPPACGLGAELVLLLPALGLLRRRRRVPPPASPEFMAAKARIEPPRACGPARSRERSLDRR